MVQKVTLPQTARVYILNEGTSGQNNAGIEFYAPNKDADIISDIFYKQNTARLERYRTGYDKVSG